MLKTKLLALFVVALTATAPLRATTRATDYPGSVTMLMELPSVRSDLGLGRDQAAKVNDLGRELKSRSQSLLKVRSSETSGLTTDQRLFALIDGNNAQALALLSPVQFARFSEIQNQILGYSMLVSPQIQKQLRCTNSQSASIEALRIRGLEFVSEMNRSFGSGVISHKNRVEILRDYRTRQAEEMKLLLSPAQRKAFAALCGKPLAKS